MRKIKLSKINSFSFFIWSSLIFSLGLIAGLNSPNDYTEKVKSYAIALEKENHKLNFRLKSCNK